MPRLCTVPGGAYAQLSAADGEAGLDLEDLERLGAAAYLVGRDEETVDVWGRAHRHWLWVGDSPRATPYAFWSAFVLLNKGELALAVGGSTGGSGYLTTATWIGLNGDICNTPPTSASRLELVASLRQLQTAAHSAPEKRC